MSKSIHAIFAATVTTIFAMVLICAMADAAAGPQASSPTPPDDIADSPHPVPERPGSSGPGQGGEKNPKMQIQMQKELSIAGVVIPWGEQRDIPAERALRKQAGQCVFRYRYVRPQLEFKAAATTIVAVEANTMQGKTDRVIYLPSKVAGGSTALGGEIALESGRSVIEVDGNSSAHAAELGGNSDPRRVVVNIQGSCGPVIQH